MPNTTKCVKAEDRVMIEDIMSRYCRSLDNGGKEEFLSVFTKSAVWISPMMGTITGHSDLGTWFDDYRTSEKDAPYRGGQHRCNNIIFEKVDDDRVETWCNWILVLPSKSGPYVGVMGNYRDIVVRENGRWLFAQRAIEIISNGVAA